MFKKSWHRKQMPWHLKKNFILQHASFAYKNFIFDRRVVVGKLFSSGKAVVNKVTHKNFFRQQPWPKSSYGLRINDRYANYLSLKSKKFIYYYGYRDGGTKRIFVGRKLRNLKFKIYNRSIRRHRAALKIKEIFKLKNAYKRRFLSTYKKICRIKKKNKLKHDKIKKNIIARTYFYTKHFTNNLASAYKPYRGRNLVNKIPFKINRFLSNEATTLEDGSNQQNANNDIVDKKKLNASRSNSLFYENNNYRFFYKGNNRLKKIFSRSVFKLNDLDLSRSYSEFYNDGTTEYFRKFERPLYRVYNFKWQRNLKWRFKGIVRFKKTLTRQSQKIIKSIFHLKKKLRWFRPWRVSKVRRKRLGLTRKTGLRYKKKIRTLRSRKRIKSFFKKKPFYALSWKKSSIRLSDASQKKMFWRDYYAQLRESWRVAILSEQDRRDHFVALASSKDAFVKPVEFSKKAALILTVIAGKSNYFLTLSTFKKYNRSQRETLKVFSSGTLKNVQTSRKRRDMKTFMRLLVSVLFFLVEKGIEKVSEIVVKIKPKVKYSAIKLFSLRRFFNFLRLKNISVGVLRFQILKSHAIRARLPKRRRK